MAISHFSLLVRSTSKVFSSEYAARKRNSPVVNAYSATGWVGAVIPEKLMPVLESPGCDTVDTDHFPKAASGGVTKFKEDHRIIRHDRIICFGLDAV